MSPISFTDVVGIFIVSLTRASRGFKSFLNVEVLFSGGCLQVVFSQSVHYLLWLGGPSSYKSKDVILTAQQHQIFTRNMVVMVDLEGLLDKLGWRNGEPSQVLNLLVFVTMELKYTQLHTAGAAIQQKSFGHICMPSHFVFFLHFVNNSFSMNPLHKSFLCKYCQTKESSFT